MSTDAKRSANRNRGVPPSNRSMSSPVTETESPGPGPGWHEAMRSVESRIAEGARLPRSIPRKTMIAFVRNYYANISFEDLEARTPGDLAGAALAHAQLAASRPGRAALVRVTNPDPETEGWRSGHTIIDIVCDDRPFLVDSVLIALARRHIGTILLVHPIVTVERDANGELLGFSGDPTAAESWMHVEVERQANPVTLEQLRVEILSAVEDATAVADDSEEMRAQASGLSVSLHQAPPGQTPLAETAEVAYASDLLAWLADGNFQFLGYRRYELVREGRTEVLRAVPGTGLGLLRERLRTPIANRLSEMPADMRKQFETPDRVIVTKDVRRSTVARNEYFDYIGVKIIGPKGRVVGEHRFLGLFDLKVFRSSVFDIPILRSKAEQVIAASGLSTSSHRGRELVDTLEAFPRDDMFQISVPELQRIAVGITNLQERKQVALFARRDSFGRFVSCLVYVPRERYSTRVAEEVADVVCEAYGGSSTEIDPRVTERILARLHIRVQLRDDAPAYVDEETVEARVASVTRWWVDDLHDELIAVLGEADGTLAYQRIADGFPPAYRSAYSPEIAVSDALRIFELSESRTTCHRADPIDWRTCQRVAIQGVRPRGSLAAVGDAPAARQPRPYGDRRASVCPEV